MRTPQSPAPFNAKDAARIHDILHVTWVGFWINLFLGLFKIAAGFLGNSRAVVADGVHSLSDLVTDVAILVGVRYWVAPADANHPHGHQRLESLIALAIGLVLAFAGVGIALDALDRLLTPRTESVGSILALIAASCSVVSKEWLFRWTLAKGKNLNSQAVEANAWDHRSDALSSVPIVFAVALAMWLPEWAVLDLCGAFLIVGFILHAAWKICLPALHTLLDTGAEQATCQKIKEIALTVPGVLGVHDLRTRYLGNDLQVDLHVSINGNLTIFQGNAIAHALEDTLRTDTTTQILGVRIIDALVHLDPWAPEAHTVR